MERMVAKNNKDKITIIIGKLIGGGAERVACNLANYLYNKGYEIDIVVANETNDTYKIKKGINVIALLPNSERKGRIHNIIIRQQTLKKYVEKNKNILCYIAMMPKSSFRMAMLRKYTDAKIIISERNDPRHHSFISKLMMRYASKRCDGLVVQTKEIRKWYKNIKNKIIIPNAVNDEVIVPRRYPIEKKFVAVGKLEKQKNYQMLIKAFSTFSAKHSDYFLEIYGQGKLEENLKTLAANYNVGGKIKFKGYAKNVLDEIANAKCFLMSSNYEGIPNALIEAMSIGLPCIATDCDGGGVRELIKNNYNGVIIKKGAVSNFVAAMNKVVEDDIFRKTISENAVKIRTDFDEKKIYGKWLDFTLRTVNSNIQLNGGAKHVGKD